MKASTVTTSRRLLVPCCKNAGETPALPNPLVATAAMISISQTRVELKNAAHRRFSGEIRNLFFADEVAAAVGAHAGGMHCAGRDVATLARAIGVCRTTLGQRHIPAEDDMSGLTCVPMVSV